MMALPEKAMAPSAASSTPERATALNAGGAAGLSGASAGAMSSGCASSSSASLPVIAGGSLQGAFQQATDQGLGRRCTLWQVGEAVLVHVVQLGQFQLHGLDAARHVAVVARDVPAPE